jgi:hypothetical protein
VVGSTLFHLNGGNGIQDGWHTSTTSSEFSTIDAPTGGVPLPPRVSGNYVLSNLTYRTENVRGDIVVKGNATLTVNADFSVNNLIVEPGASIKLYVNAASASLSRVENRNIRAESFMYYGLAGNRNIALGGNGSFCGVIFAPNAELSISGGGSDVIDFLGAIIARIVDVKGHMNFHFDEATTRLGSRGFIANRWDEL